jgi:hypothetical protein
MNIVIRICHIFLFFGIIGCSQCYAMPLFALNTKQWTDSSQIFLANDRDAPTFMEGVDKISILKPIEPREDSQILDLVNVWPPQTNKNKKVFLGWSDFKEKNKLRKPLIYALQNTSARGGAIVCQLAAETGAVQTLYRWPYPLKNGYLRVDDVYYAGEWHTVLLVVGNRMDKPTSIAFVFDIGNSAIPFSPMLCLSDELPELNEVSKPYSIRLPNEKWVVAIPGIWKKEGAVVLVSLEHPFSPTVLTTGQSEALSRLTPIDFLMCGQADTLYAIDSAGSVWHFNLNPTPQPSGHKMAHQAVIHALDPLLVLKGKDAGSVELLYSGKTNGEKMRLLP